MSFLVRVHGYFVYNISEVKENACRFFVEEAGDIPLCDVLILLERAKKIEKLEFSGVNLKDFPIGHLSVSHLILNRCAVPRAFQLPSKLQKFGMTKLAFDGNKMEFFSRLGGVEYVWGVDSSFGDQDFGDLVDAIQSSLYVRTLYFKRCHRIKSYEPNHLEKLQNNVSLTEITCAVGPFLDRKIQKLCDRNKLGHRTAVQSVLFLIGMNQTPCHFYGGLGVFPREIRRKIAMYVWQSYGQRCWIKEIPFDPKRQKFEFF